MKGKFYRHSCCVMVLAHATFASDDTPTFKIDINNHVFNTDIVVVPANTKIKLIVHNHDRTAEEIESRSLKIKKIILGNREAFLFIGPLPEGDYSFMGAFNRRTATGVIRAKSKAKISTQLHSSQNNHPIKP